MAKNGSKREQTKPPFRFSIIEERDDEVTIEVSEEGYQREMEAGILPEETLKPGRYVGKRGGFQKRNPNFSATKAKVEIGFEKISNSKR